MYTKKSILTPFWEISMIFLENYILYDFDDPVQRYKI